MNAKLNPGLNGSIDEKFMRRCLQLAKNGRQYVAPNPMVGSVIVYDGKIIGEGFHREYGKAHAEVNAINSVKEKNLLKEATIYVSLEPCSHYGKTPPCSQLIIDCGIPKVVVATLDPFHKVSGRGVRMLKDAGVEVKVGVLEEEAKELNKEFFTAQVEERPYIYLKWAQTQDGFIDKKRIAGAPIQPTPISNSLTQLLVHKMRAEIAGIMIGTNTAVKDNPSLTTRLWYGKNPVRIILDRSRRIPSANVIFDKQAETLLFSEHTEDKPIGDGNILIPLSFGNDMIPVLLKELNKRKINSILVEGGTALLQSFIDSGLWDEAFIEVSNNLFFDGIKAPSVAGMVVSEKNVGSSRTLHLVNN